MDPRYGHVYRYHPRSPAHSRVLCRFILEDLLRSCRILRKQAARGLVICGIDYKHTWPNTGKEKTLDLAIGRPAGEPHGDLIPGMQKGEIAKVLVSLEAKSVMTEHGKSQPRVFDELSSSHEIAHQGDPRVIAAGITVVNIADTFVSPLRQTSRDELDVTDHNQPNVTESMVQHLRGLPIRDDTSQPGFEAYSTIVVDCDNQGPATLWTDPPAPQPAERDHYDTFLERIGTFYTHRFGDLG